MSTAEAHGVGIRGCSPLSVIPATLLLLISPHAGRQQSMPSPSHRVAHRNHSNGNKPESKSAPQIPPPATISSEIGQQTAQAVQGRPEAKPYDWRSAFAPPTWSNWALVAVGIVASIVGIRSLRAVRRQSEATEKSADAAKLSSTALINIERPWLLVSSAHRRQDHPPEKNPLLCFFKVTNYGKIPARIIEVGGAFTTVSDMRELPTKPKYGAVKFYNSRPLAVNMESSEIWMQHEANKFGRLETESTESSGKREICIGFGFVKYTGSSFDREEPKTSREPYETKFCYCFYSHSPANPCGPPGYNDHT